MGRRPIWRRGAAAVALALVSVGVLAPASGAGHPCGGARALPQCIPTGPANTAAPTISGSTTPGSRLSTTDGGWTPVFLTVARYALTSTTDPG